MDKGDLGNLMTNFKYLSDTVRKGNRVALQRSRGRLEPAGTFCGEMNYGSHDLTVVHSAQSECSPVCNSSAAQRLAVANKAI